MSRVETPATVPEVVTDLLHAVDLRDWGTVRANLAESVHTDYTSLLGGTPQTQSGDALVRTWQALVPGFDATQHLLGPIRVHAQDAVARVECAVTATHVLGAERWVVGGHYEISLARVGGRWRVDGIRLRTAFVDGDRDLPKKAAARVASG